MLIVICKCEVIMTGELILLSFRIALFISTLKSPLFNINKKQEEKLLLHHFISSNVVEYAGFLP